jgi:hypothetical protein
MRFFCFIALSISLVLSGSDALARSRASRRASSSDRHHSSSRGRSTRERGRRGESVSRRGRHGREERYARARHGRRDRYARSSRRYEPRETVAASYSRPASGIPTERATEIQNALIKGGYLSGPASGQYDDATSSAMRRFQSANGMQATGLPSAASLKRLGVAKGSNDGYAVPIKSATHRESSPPPASPDAVKPKP